MPKSKVGCILADGHFYPYTCKPDDVYTAMERDRDNYFFIDVQARGEYPVWALKRMEKVGIKIKMEDGDSELLKIIRFNQVADEEARF
ncbi:MAG: family 1 glycosylhydrolase, partial [Tissierellia bacterium]|nr:family 1 glycosylhydrolase [Tissierellia bacterium]